MFYSSLYFRKKNSSILMLILGAVSVAIIFLGIFLGKNLHPSRAQKANLLRHDIVNLSSTQAGIFWQTDKQERGWIIFGESRDNLNKISLDERDIEQNKNSYLNHYVLLKDLQPGKNYYYKIVSDKQIYSSSQEQSFILKTPPNVTIKNIVNPAYGKIIQTNNLPKDNTFVIFNIEKYFPLLTITKPTGEWLIPLNYLVEKDSNQIIGVDPKSIALIELIDGDGNKSSISAPLGRTSPLPQTIVFGKDYRFSEEGNVLSESDYNNISQEEGAIAIIYPKEGVVISSTKPLIKGVGIAGREIIVMINSNPQYSFRTLVNKEGVWQIDLSQPLSAGNYLLTMTTTDEKGKPQSFWRQFTIAKSGEQVKGIATPSATITQALPVLSPTSFATVTPPALISPSTTPPVTGKNFSNWIFLSVAFLIIGSGFLFLFR